jgi:hypothetical protein
LHCKGSISFRAAKALKEEFTGDSRRPRWVIRRDCFLAFFMSSPFSTVRFRVFRVVRGPSLSVIEFCDTSFFIPELFAAANVVSGEAVLCIATHIHVDSLIGTDIIDV